MGDMLKGTKYIGSFEVNLKVKNQGLKGKLNRAGWMNYRRKSEMLKEGMEGKIMGTVHKMMLRG